MTSLSNEHQNAMHESTHMTVFRLCGRYLINLAFLCRSIIVGFDCHYYPVKVLSARKKLGIMISLR